MSKGDLNSSFSLALNSTYNSDRSRREETSTPTRGSASRVNGEDENSFGTPSSRPTGDSIARVADTLRSEAREREAVAKGEVERLSSALGSLSTRVDALDSRLNSRIDGLETRLSQRLDALEPRSANFLHEQMTLIQSLNKSMAEEREHAARAQMDFMNTMVKTVEQNAERTMSKCMEEMRRERENWLQYRKNADAKSEDGGHEASGRNSKASGDVVGPSHLSHVTQPTQQQLWNLHQQSQAYQALPQYATGAAGYAGVSNQNLLQQQQLAQALMYLQNQKQQMGTYQQSQCVPLPATLPSHAEQQLPPQPPQIPAHHTPDTSLNLSASHPKLPQAAAAPSFSFAGPKPPPTAPATNPPAAHSTPLAKADTSGAFSFAGFGTGRPSVPAAPAVGASQSQGTTSVIKSPAQSDLAQLMHGTPTATINASRVSECSDTEDHYEPNVEFTPVCPLPDLIEVTTGEEEEEVLFCQRSKLFRYDPKTKEFKERGVGDLKILKHKETGKIRVLMRREQVHKLCANHYLMPPMELKAMQKSDKAWIWMAKDFSEGEVTDETLAARFKTPELANNFKEVFDSSVKEMGERGVGNTPKKEEKPREEKKAAEPPSGFGDEFKPKAGSWECSGCMTRVDADKTTCPCCQTGKDGKPSGGGSVFGSGGNTTKLPFAAPANAGGFQFGVKPAAAALPFASPTGQKEAPAPAPATTNPSGFSFGGFSFNKSPVVQPVDSAKAAEKKETPKADTKPSVFSGFQGFGFGSPALATPSPASSANTSTNFTTPNAASGAGSIFGTPKSVTPSDSKASGGIFAASSFSALAAKSSTDSGFASKASDSKLPNPFAGKGAQLFGGPPTAARANTSRVSESSDTEDHYEPNVEFTPVCPLPDLIEVTTGEEEEEVLFCQRSKLFRYDPKTKEFKERGVGDLKILKHKETSKIRVLMRREQVHKLCANHYLMPPMELKAMQKSDKAWIWMAKDFSEGEVTDETLAARFKTPELANKFKEVFESSVKEMGEKGLGNTPTKEEKPKVAEPPKPGFGEQFKPKAGSWECSGCMTRVEADKTTCPCCQTGKDGKPAGSTSLFGSGGNTTKLPFSTQPGSAGVSFGFGAPPAATAKSESEEEREMQAEEDREEVILARLAECAVKGEEGSEGSASTAEPNTPIMDARASLLMNPTPPEWKTKNPVGDVKVEWDEDVDGYRVSFTHSDGTVWMNHLIVKTQSIKPVTSTSAATAKKMPGVTWNAQDFASSSPVRRTFTLLFSSPSTRDEFISAFNDGLKVALNNNLGEMDPAGSVTVAELEAQSAAHINALRATMAKTNGQREE